MLKDHLCSTCEDTEKLALTLAKTLKPGAVLAFFGDLGTGKTTFVRYLTQHLAHAAPEIVTSPTFQYLNIYTGKVVVYHFDLYRLRDPADFIHMGFDEMFSTDGICCIEWAERIEPILPPETIRITITHGDQNTRLIQIKEPL